MSGIELIIYFAIGIGYLFTMNPVLAFILYIVPIIIALCRNHNNKGVVCLLNILFGWITLLWFILLIWSIVGDSKPGEEESSKMTDDELKRHEAAKDREKKAMEMYKDHYN